MQAGKVVGTHLLDSNRCWNYFQIVCALPELHGRDWEIRPHDDFVFDQRMLDPGVRIAALSSRLPALL